MRKRLTDLCPPMVTAFPRLIYCPFKFDKNIIIAWLSMSSVSIPAHLSATLTQYNNQWQSLPLSRFPPPTTLQHREELCRGFEELLSALLSAMSCRIYAWVVESCMNLFNQRCARLSTHVFVHALWDAACWVMSRQMVHTPGFGGADMPT